MQIPGDLEQKLAERATQLIIPLATLILDFLAELVEPLDPDDTPKAVVLERLQASLEDIKAGQVSRSQHSGTALP